jgi:tripartite-type tricarboxylate transporter receptor subunit TctC
MPYPVTRLLLAAALLIPGAAGNALAAWPERPVTLVAQFAAGGINDLLARLTAERLQAAFKRPFVVENQVGAGGIIATERVARATPDGYTLLFSTISQITIAPYTNKISYDPVREFTPISTVATAPFFITVNDRFPARTIEEFIAYVKSKPGALPYGSAGPGSLSHLASAIFLKRAGLDMIHVPYKGLAPALTDLLAGNIVMLSPSPIELQAYRESKLLRLLAVSSPERNRAYPDVPAVAEMFPGHSVVTWNGLLAPAGTAGDIVAALAGEIAAAEKSTEFQVRLQKLGVDPLDRTPEEFAAMIAADLKRWRDIVHEMGLEPQ